jgi:hypothetical protein
MLESIHMVRWILQLKELGWELYLFPACDDRGAHNEMDEVIFVRFIGKEKSH